ncbi:hypothetical protein JW887_01225 [Candidatus Dojkabacteria bacterium]|nr:hypothetical protein [Candidatus Dojkabacteria bacterium]
MSETKNKKTKETNIENLEKTNNPDKSEIVRDLKKYVNQGTDEVVTSSKKYFVEANREEAIVQGTWDFYRMRKQWSNILVWALFIIIFFNIILVFLVGFGVLHFKDEWFLRIVLTTNLADIIGLMVVVVKFLFHHRPDEISND